MHTPLLHTLVTDDSEFDMYLSARAEQRQYNSAKRVYAHDLDTSATSMVHTALHNFRIWFTK